MSRLTSLALLGAVACLAACSAPSPSQKLRATAKVALAPTAPGPKGLAAVAPGAPPALSLSASGPAINPAEADMPAVAQAINAAGFAPAVAAPSKEIPSVSPTLVKVEVLLDRAGFSPGVIDGRGGDNLDRAIEAFSFARGLHWDGKLESATWDALVGSDPGPAVRTYRITEQDVAGPFIGAPPKDYGEMAKLPSLAYSAPDQLLAERFHMDRRLLRSLNPDADFSKAGTTIIVTAPRDGPRDLQVARLEVDKTHEAIRAYDSANRLVAYYPASVGSEERPAPSGIWAVKAVAPRPAYYYDPKRLTFAPLGATGRLKIAAGPNNPVGSTWIGLTVPTYGIHGSPDPSLVGKRQSHGCVRLTNWDAAELGRSVKAGTQVSFVGDETRAGARV